MANRRRAHDEAWTNAKKVCRLTARQVEMARALGMNPRTLLGLRPTPPQRWKRPVGKFIPESLATKVWSTFVSTFAIVTGAPGTTP